MLLYLVAVICLYLMTNGASPVAQWWRICLPMQEMWVQSLGWEDPLKKKMATHSSILAWDPWTEELDGNFFFKL